jgi:hypothetical protein
MHWQVLPIAMRQILPGMARSEDRRFVPEGPNDRSQASRGRDAAAGLPGTRPIENPSRGALSDPYPGLINRPNRGTRLSDPIIPYPSGRIPF